MRQLRSNGILSACLVTLLAPCGAFGADKNAEYFIEVGPTTTTPTEYPVRVVSIPTIGFNMRFVQYARPGYERPAAGDDGGFAPEHPTLTLNPNQRTNRPGVSADGESFGQPGPAGNGQGRTENDPSQLTPATENPFQFSNAQGVERPEDPSELDPGEADPEEEAGDPDDGQPDDDGFMPADCNGNGVSDNDEIMANFGLDQDGNGRIDRCEQSGDVNYDGRIDMDDLVAVIMAWGTCPSGDGTCHEDVNQDGQINEEDVAVIIVHWNFDFQVSTP